MIQFGTGGWRAIIADGFTKANVQLLGSALAKMMRDHSPDNMQVIIGYDRRFLSRESAYWLAEALTARLVVCHIIDREAPTPLIMYAVKELGVPFGLAVTASHNPAVYNGVKLFVREGRDAPEPVTKDLEGYIRELAATEIRTLKADEAKSLALLDEINPQNDYIDDILRHVDTEAIKNASLKIALDPMYGVSQTCLRTILMTARCDVLVIHERHDTLFGGRLPAPNVNTLSALSTFTVENGCDFGIATDGDADRLGVIDDGGRFIHPNQLLSILYYYLLEYKGWRGDAVRNVSTTHQLDRIARSYGQQCHEVPVGFKHISAGMGEHDAIIGGESSGGLTVRGHIFGKDGIYAAALLTEMVAVTGKGISTLYRELAERFGEACIADRELHFRGADKPMLTDKIYREHALPEYGGGDFAVSRTSYADGLKVFFENGGWVTVRFSGTEPLLRVNTEMPTQELADEAARRTEAFLDGLTEKR
ncbi:MAG: phosphoglucomutase/phosphomannomutase family protein [Clostridiales Family XIII bacterium]|jgi:phosphomannomutase|nr:phosphoglucomutase/phosphomannomutase family protein [Clostridiales Family XIII bacterium]